jgi:HD-GYP domain-containing protein (c-di-GMP phosphodiesterase class II)
MKALPGILYHHEHYDGNGYPERLSGEEIPLIARIIAIADTYDAINSNRAYRSGRPPHEALAIIRDLSGTQFDAKIVKIFMEVLKTDTAAQKQTAEIYRSG